jgi:hypothetical protein
VKTLVDELTGAATGDIPWPHMGDGQWARSMPSRG